MLKRKFPFRISRSNSPYLQHEDQHGAVLARSDYHVGVPFVNPCWEKAKLQEMRSAPLWLTLLKEDRRGKTKARKIKDTLKLHGHGHDHDQNLPREGHAPDDHDLDDEDDEEFDDPEVHNVGAGSGI